MNILHNLTFLIIFEIFIGTLLSVVQKGRKISIFSRALTPGTPPVLSRKATGSWLPQTLTYSRYPFQIQDFQSLSLDIFLDHISTGGSRLAQPFNLINCSDHLLCHDILISVSFLTRFLKTCIFSRSFASVTNLFFFSRRSRMISSFTILMIS